MPVRSKYNRRAVALSRRLTPLACPGTTDLSSTKGESGPLRPRIAPRHPPDDPARALRVPCQDRSRAYAETETLVSTTSCARCLCTRRRLDPAGSCPPPSLSGATSIAPVLGAKGRALCPPPVVVYPGSQSASPRPVA